MVFNTGQTETCTRCGEEFHVGCMRTWWCPRCTDAIEKGKPTIIERTIGVDDPDEEGTQ